MTALVVEALTASEQRGLLMSGWGGLTSAQVPKTVLAMESAPHDWLFARMAAVVHHGGAGTVGAGVRAGVPQVVVPSIADQVFWGHQVVGLGIGPPPVTRKRLSADGLAAAIESATTSAPLRMQAALLGERIRAEDGVANAVQVFKDTIANGQPISRSQASTSRT